jgi:hypothetical protein
LFKPISAASTPTPGPTRAKLNIFDFNEMSIEMSLTGLSQEFTEYKNVIILIIILMF